MASRITKWFKGLDFKKQFIEEEKMETPTSKKLTINDLKVYDDVFIKLKGKVYDAWVTLINANNISLCYEDKDKDFQEIIFQIRGLYNESIVVENDKSLILNKEDLNE